MNMLQEADALFTAVRVTGEVPTLAQRLHAAHMELVTALARAQTQLHDAGYQATVRTAIVGPAHLAVRESSWRMAQLAAQAPGAEA